nr:hypothetical protein [Tanacetum cinerariifolium]GEY74475.1 hypothetical protein [Tanacetum cinerariifolium]
MNESDLNDIHVNESEVLNNLFYNRKSSKDDNQVNDGFKKGKRHHALSPPYTGNYISPRADLSFVGLDNYVFKSKGNPQYALQDQEIFDSGCSRHMIGNKSYLIDYQEIDTQYCCVNTAVILNTAKKAQIQALVDKKKVIIIEASIRRDLRFEDEGGVDCLSNKVIFEQLTLMGTMAFAIICLVTNQKFNFSNYIFDNMVKHLDGGVKFMMYPRFVQVLLDNQVEGMDKHNAIFIISSYIKKVFANMKKEGKDFSRKVTPLFQSMMVQAPEDMGKGLEIPTDPHHTPIVTQPSSSQSQKKQRLRRKRRKEIEVPSPSSEIPNEEGVPITSNDPLPSEAKTAQAKEIASLEKRVKKLEQKRKSRTSGLKRLRKVGSARRAESSSEASLGDQKDASKQGRMIDNIDHDVEITLVDETPRRINKEDMFRVNDLDGDEDELTLARTLIEIKAVKPKSITTVVTTVTVAGIKPKEKGIAMQEPSETPSPKPIDSFQKPSQAKDKGNGKMMLFNNTMKWIEAFVPMDTELVKGDEKAVEGSSSKRAGSNLEQKDAKRQMLEEENEFAELKRCLEIILEDDDDVIIKATPLSSKSPTIVNYTIYKERKKSFFKIIRADGNS